MKLRVLASQCPCATWGRDREPGAQETQWHHTGDAHPARKQEWISTREEHVDRRFRHAVHLDIRVDAFKCRRGPHTQSQNCLDFATPDLEITNHSCKPHTRTGFCFYYLMHFQLTCSSRNSTPAHFRGVAHQDKRDPLAELV